MTPEDARIHHEAVTMMKLGTAPAAVYQRLVASGIPDWDARALVDRLVEQKRQAEALDPKRLRGEAVWMFWNGAGPEDVVRHFVSVGVSEEHARPEVDKIRIAVEMMKPCDRCRRPMEPADAFFDGAGRQVCRQCHSVDEIGNAERRVLDSTLEMAGVPTWAIHAAGQTSYMNQGLANAPPLCPRCKAYAGVHVNAVHPHARAHVPYGYAYVCSRCWAGIC